MEQHTGEKIHHHFTLFIDGASRNNPGLAGAGIYLLKDSEVICREGFFLGTKTNNQAEYLALLLGLLLLQQYRKSGDTVRVVSDSELLVKQINGEYKVKNQQLKLLHNLAYHLIQKCNGHVMHVLRTENIEADRMANAGINKKIPVPQAFINVLQTYEITV